VKYVGDEHVSVKGTRTAHIAPHQFATLAAKAEKIRFFDLEDSYGGIKIGDSIVTITDQPTTIVTVTRAGKAKRVRDYIGAPKGLYESHSPGSIDRPIQILWRFSRCQWCA
jgi:hypothetical protein